ncbi:uncharacterized protein LOC143287770 [Babylonia areolata]|uniref:uncharacterized protein LOC143287770 n=1 Tax=Babylonia areolata TaxID=304850 RepID=UPI003FCFD247
MDIKGKDSLDTVDVSHEYADGKRTCDILSSLQLFHVSKRVRTIMHRSSSQQSGSSSITGLPEGMMDYVDSWLQWQRSPVMRSTGLPAENPAFRPAFSSTPSYDSLPEVGRGFSIQHHSGYQRLRGEDSASLDSGSPARISHTDITPTPSSSRNTQPPSKKKRKKKATKSLWARLLESWRQSEQPESVAYSSDELEESGDQWVDRAQGLGDVTAPTSRGARDDEWRQCVDRAEGLCAATAETSGGGHSSSGRHGFAQRRQTASDIATASLDEKTRLFHSGSYKVAAPCDLHPVKRALGKIRTCCCCCCHKTEP